MKPNGVTAPLVAPGAISPVSSASRAARIRAKRASWSRTQWKTALENAARTLSVEWARFGVRITAVRPREGASADERAELVAFLASPAGDYFTGCSFYPGAAL